MFSYHALSLFRLLIFLCYYISGAQIAITHMED